MKIKKSSFYLTIVLLLILGITFILLKTTDSKNQNNSVSTKTTINNTDRIKKANSPEAEENQATSSLEIENNVLNTNNKIILEKMDEMTPYPDSEREYTADELEQKRQAILDKMDEMTPYPEQ